jgi:hypothetical protein
MHEHEIVVRISDESKGMIKIARSLPLSHSLLPVYLLKMDNAQRVLKGDKKLRGNTVAHITVDQARLKSYYVRTAFIPTCLHEKLTDPNDVGILSVSGIMP